MRIFGFIVAKKAEHSITIMCRVLEVSPVRGVFPMVRLASQPCSASCAAL